MCERQVVELAEEIRELYRRQCACADRVNAAVEADARQLADRCRAPESADMPELQHFENVFECQDALSEAGRDPRVRRWLKLAYMVNCAVLFGGCLFVQLYTASFLAMVPAGTLLAAGLLILEHRFLYRPYVKRSLREQLLGRGVPICLECGYDLCGQFDPRCPECGAPCGPNVLKARAGE